MTYLRTSSRPGQQRSRFLIRIVALFVVIVIAIHFVMPSFIPGLWMSLVRPFWRMEFALESGALRSPEALLEKNESLRRDLDEASIRLDTIRAIEHENIELKALLGRPLTASTTGILENENRVLAAVLKRPPFAPYDELVIDIGNDMDLAVGDKVYAPGKVLIGTVGEVVGKSSKVVLFSSPGKQYEVLVGPAHVPTTAIGRGGGQYEAQLARDVVVTEGDFVDAPSISDLPFGVITTVIADPTLPFVTVIFVPPVNIYELRWVMVEKH